MGTEAAERQAPPQHKEVEHFTDAERAAWLKDGTMPPLEEEPSRDGKEKVSPDDKGAAAASTPASGDGGKGSGSGPGKKERDQERNFKELRERAEAAERDRDALRAENDEWKTGKRKVEEKKAEEAKGPKLLEAPKRPKVAEFTDGNGNFNVAKYEEALEKYDTDKEAYNAQQTQLRGAKAEQERTLNTWGAELKAKYGDGASKVDVKKTVDQLVSTMQEAPAFFAFLNDSEVFTDLLYVLGTDENLPALIEEAKKNPTKAIRRLIALEEGVRVELAKFAEAKKKANGSAEDGEQGGGRKLTQAGKPPSESAGSSSSPNDDGSPDAAWRRKDLSPSERGELYRERKNKEEREKKRKKTN